MILLFLGLSSAFFSKQWFDQASVSSQGGGVNCAACTIVTSIVEQLSVIHNKPVEDVMDLLCEWLPTGPQETCLYLVATYGADITKFLESGLNPDEVCHGLQLCTDPTCVMYPTTGKQIPPMSSKAKAARSSKRQSSIWQWLEELFLAVAQHEPDADFDSDLFSSEPVLRGYNFRGRDCDNFDANIHPGRASGVAGQDFDCNGISGFNPTTQKPYKDELCNGTPHFGVVAIGDSAGAHFSIPPSYMNASEIGPDTYDNLLWVLADEIDHPHMGGYTGFYNSTKTVIVDSLYKRMRERNRCLHRDYQNLCVNGFRSSTVIKLVETMSRNNKTDHPVLVAWELIGNDVCNGHHTFDTMTTPAEFKKNVLGALAALDQRVPAGSHVSMIGLADGLVLWDSMHNRTHPIGVTYKVVYDYLNCLHISPCWGWMNSNETVRNFTQTRADELNLVYKDIVANFTFKNFDMVYYDFPFKAILRAWISMGGVGAYQLLEPIDGFHPNQVANYLGAAYFWNQFQMNQPSFIGPVNPNNKKIISLFGDQGGY